MVSGILLNATLYSFDEITFPRIDLSVTAVLVAFPCLSCNYACEVDRTAFKPDLLLYLLFGAVFLLLVANRFGFRFVMYWRSGDRTLAGKLPDLSEHDSGSVREPVIGFLIVCIAVFDQIASPAEASDLDSSDVLNITVSPIVKFIEERPEPGVEHGGREEEPLSRNDTSLLLTLYSTGAGSPDDNNNPP